MRSKIANWLICLFVIPLLPFFIVWAILFVSDPTVGALTELTAFWNKGEFLLLAIAMAATGFCDLSTSSRPRIGQRDFVSPRPRSVRWARTVALASACVVFAVSLALYFAIASCVIHHANYDEGFVIYRTPVIFLFSAMVGLACVVLSKET